MMDAMAILQLLVTYGPTVLTLLKDAEPLFQDLLAQGIPHEQAVAQAISQVAQQRTGEGTAAG
jgi:hypothetical protein